jgi:hypothetical protein
VSDDDYYEGRIASLRTGIKMALAVLEPGGLLPAESKLEIARRSLEALLNSDLDKALAKSEPQQCGAPSSRQPPYLCVLPKGHRGPHYFAQPAQGITYEEWSNLAPEAQDHLIASGWHPKS